MIEQLTGTASAHYEAAAVETKPARPANRALSLIWIAFGIASLVCAFSGLQVLLSTVGETQIDPDEARDRFVLWLTIAAVIALGGLVAQATIRGFRIVLDEQSRR